jgi:enamine deaminase RidA (YjgF/YER057c/UK114 family)
MNFETRLIELGLILPTMPPSKGIHRPCLEAGGVLYVSGHLPFLTDGNLMVGKVGDNLNAEQGAAAARQCGLAMLASLKNYLGDLDRIQHLVKTFGMVNSTADFDKHTEVINGFSQLFVDLLGDDAGKGTRSAVGMGSLPRGVAVEVEAVFLIS